MPNSANVVLLAILAAASPTPFHPDLTGMVFVDRNANGARDAGEPGLPGVPVSDQNEVVVTGADGSLTVYR